MSQLELPSGSETPLAIGASFAEILGLAAAEQVELFRRAHRRYVSGRYDEVVTLTAIAESRAYEAAGCSSIQQFAARVGDYTKREVRDMLCMGRALRQCPELDAAFRSGRLTWSKVRTLVPVVTSQNAARWIATAMHMSTGALERLVGQQREPHGIPGMAPMPEVAIPVFVAFRHLCVRLREWLCKPGMPDAECAAVLLGMAGWAFEQHAEEALNAVGCAKATPREEALAVIELSEPPGRMAESSEERPAASAEDSTDDDETPHVGYGSPSGPSIAASATPSIGQAPPFNHSRHIPEPLRRSVLARAGYRCEAPGCTSPHAIELHHLIPFVDGGPHTTENLRVWCHRCHELCHRSRASGLDES